MSATTRSPRLVAGVAGRRARGERADRRPFDDMADLFADLDRAPLAAR